MSRSPLLTVREVADQLQVTEETVRRWIRRGELGALELGGPRTVYRIRPEDFDRFVWQRYSITAKHDVSAPPSPSSRPNFQDVIEHLPVISFVFEPDTSGSGTVSYISREIDELLGVPRDEWYEDLTSVWRSLIPPEAVATMTERARQYREQLEIGSSAGRNHFSTEVRVLSRRQELVWLELDMELVRSPTGEPLYWSGVVVDISRRKQVEHELGLRLERAERLERFSRRAIEEERLTVLLNEAVHLVTEVLQVEYARVFEVVPGGHYMSLRATVGWASGQVGEHEVNAGAVGHVIVDVASDSHAAYTLNVGEPVASDDLELERRFNGRLMVTRRGLWSGLYVIIHGKGRPFGVLGAHAAQRRAYESADVEFLTAVASTLGMAVTRSAEQWLTIPEVAAALQVSLETVRRWIRSGDLSAVLLGGTRTGYRIHSSDLQRFTEQRLTG